MSALAYSYVRFSSAPQSQGTSRERQMAMASHYASRNGLVLDRELCFRDLGVSAFRGHNSRYGALRIFLDAVEAELIPRGSYLLVESLDRLSRDQILPAQALFLQIIYAGIILVTLVDERTYSTETINANPYELIISLLAMMRANEESELKSRRLKAAWVAKRARATRRVMTARCPGWLTLDRSTGQFGLVQEHVETVRRIFREALGNKGREAIAKGLNQDRVRLLSGRTIAERPWSSANVARIMNCLAVTGSLVPHTNQYTDGKRSMTALPPIENYYPAIIAPSDFDAVQKLLAKRRELNPGDAPFWRCSNIFARLARCPLCGAGMKQMSLGLPDWRYLVCTRAVMKGGCIRRSVRYPELEEAFVDEIEQIIDGFPWPDATRTRRDQRLRWISSRLSLLSVERADLIRTRDRVIHPKSRPLPRLAKIDEEAKALQAERRLLQCDRPRWTSVSLERRLSELKEAATRYDLDRPRLNAVLRSLLLSIRVDYPQNRLVLEWRHDKVSDVKLNPDVMRSRRGYTIAHRHPPAPLETTLRQNEERCALTPA